MKPQTALKINYSVFETYTRAQIEAARDEWISEYKKIAEAYPKKASLCDKCIERIERAAALFISRKVEPAVSDATNHDDYYYEWLDENKKEEDAAFDGDFPLGNEEDMVFASPYFTVRELALIQTGLSHTVECGCFTGYNTDVLVRKGVVAEMQGKWDEAASAYAGVWTSASVQKRESACRKKAAAEGEHCPMCGSANIRALDGVGAVGKRGENITLEICPEMRICNICGTTFRIDLP